MPVHNGTTALPFKDDDLSLFDTHGAPPLPAPNEEGRVENKGASIWYASFGVGPTVVLLHGGLGNSGNWGNQVPSLTASGFQVITIDSRGHGRSTRDGRPYSYDLMGSDVLAVLDELDVTFADLIGWSDGACSALILADQFPSRVRKVIYFACNMDASGTKPFELTAVIERCLSRHKKDYAALSATPEAFDDFFTAVGLMQRTQPNYSAEDLARIVSPVLVLHAEFDEFIKREHAEYLAQHIPAARFQLLNGVSHFAPIQRPHLFNKAILSFLQE